MEVRSPGPGVLVVQRAWLPLYRATLDGLDVPIKIANLHRIAVDVPPGTHQVAIRIEERPFYRSLLGVALGLVGMALLIRRGARP